MLLTYEQAAAELTVSKRTVERLVARGHLPVVEILGARRVRSEDVEAFVALQATQDAAGGPVSAAGQMSCRQRRVSSFRQQLRAAS